MRKSVFGLVMGLLVIVMSGCSAARESVKVREKDSVSVKYRTVTRDSVVVRVDAATGEVVGKDTWHWRDTDNDRSQVSAIKETAKNGDSLTSTAVLRRDSVVVPLRGKNGSEGQKSGWKWFLWGMCCGIGVCAAWKWRKFVLRMG